jgi:Protein of unknown function (DUF3500)
VSRVRALSAAAAALVLASCSSGGSSAAVTPASTSAAGVSASAPAPSGSVTPAVTKAATAFLATLDATQKGAVQFAWTDTAQKQRWSNFPSGAFQRAGLKWGDLSTAQQDAWLAIMKASLSVEGYKRILAEWAADDANAAATGQSQLFGKAFYYIALIGTPSDSGPWMWQFGGHHVTVNATIAAGRVSVTPSFIGDQPSSYTDASGATVVPLGDIQDEAFALVNSLDDTQKKAAVLDSTPIDLVLGPGEDGKTVAPEGVPGSQLTPAQRAAALRLIGHYTGLADDADAAARRAEITAGMAQTYFAWYGPTTAGSAAYFRFTGPALVIEYAPQGDPQGDKTPTNAHIHGIYRDPTNEYGAKYAS